MNRKEAAELLPIIQAYSEGKTILVKDKRLSDEEDSWSETDDCSFNIEKFDYRIKPEHTYRPFKDAEECWCEMLKHEPFGWVIRNDYHVNIANLIRQSITFADNEGRNSSFSELLEDCTFVDGKKFGIKEE